LGNTAPEKEADMLTRFLTRSFSALALLTIAAVPVWAHDSCDYEARGRYRGYGYDQRDRYDRYDYYGRGHAQGFGHALGDLFRYGTTDPYSSPEHYYRDQRRAYDRYRRDQYRGYRHDSRDRYEGYGRYSDHGYGHYDSRD
jgi:hypothetical protein